MLIGNVENGATHSIDETPCGSCMPVHEIETDCGLRNRSRIFYNKAGTHLKQRVNLNGVPSSSTISNYPPAEKRWTGYNFHRLCVLTSSLLRDAIRWFGIAKDDLGLPIASYAWGSKLVLMK